MDCAACGMPMHRFGFNPDGSGGDRDGHSPTLIACGNGILRLVEQEIDRDGPLHDRISIALMKLAIWCQGRQD